MYKDWVHNISNNHPSFGHAARWTQAQKVNCLLGEILTLFGHSRLWGR